VASALEANCPIHLAFAIADHPWADTPESAAVRIAMTVGEAGLGQGGLATVAREIEHPGGEPDVELGFGRGGIHEDLRLGADVAGASALRANSRIANMGLILGGRGFVLTQEEAEHLLSSQPPDRRLIYPLKNTTDITKRPRGVFVIDPIGWNEE